MLAQKVCPVELHEYEYQSQQHQLGSDEQVVRWKLSGRFNRSMRHLPSFILEQKAASLAVLTRTRCFCSNSIRRAAICGCGTTRRERRDSQYTPNASSRQDEDAPQCGGCSAHPVAQTYRRRRRLNSKAFDIIGGGSPRKEMSNSKASRKFSLTA
jgi:hypothetical protein